MSYAITIRLEVDADTAPETRELLGGPLNRLFEEPFVLAMEVEVPTWVPVSGRREANPAA